MALRRKKGYKFSDETMAKDAIISLCFGGLAIVCIIFSIVMAVALKGQAPASIGALLLAAAIMAVTAFIFGLISYRDQDSGVLSKRASVMISLIDMVLIVVLYLI